MSSRIEQIIEEIEEYVDSCKFQPLSSTKIVVNKEELEELLRELRMKTPDEIKTLPENHQQQGCDPCRRSVQGRRYRCRGQREDPEHGNGERDHAGGH